MAQEFSRHSAGATAPDEEMYDQQALTRVLAPTGNAVARRGTATRRGGIPAATQTPPIMADDGAQMRSGSIKDDIGMPKIQAPGYEAPEADGPSYGDAVRAGNGGINPNPGKIEMAGDVSSGLAAAAPQAGGTPLATAAPAVGGVLEGWDRGKLDSGHDSPKYQVGRILQKYPSTPAGLQQALAEINALGIGTAEIAGSKGDKLRFGGDKLDPRFNGVTEFDVIRAAGEGGKGWQWMDANAGGGEQVIDDGGFHISGRPSSIMGASSLAGQLSSGTAQDSLIAKLQAQLGAGEGGLDQQMLERILGSART